ncbi:hypothetical protein ABOM_001853 [Aspergillus bombycis]|uniref:DUF2306 domain-containing protein n=1 Tax=Aspergillus bombycis TaxID=109264 RepID=A0A1F8AD82_9EURO|nr:hypothetical protein ABOM_001853 [Aspergillus bombycis]OGM49637.1 hypothetical protein ABOM_001853 [Aspergillus bombycis]
MPSIDLKPASSTVSTYETAQPAASHTSVLRYRPPHKVNHDVPDNAASRDYQASQQQRVTTSLPSRQWRIMAVAAILTAAYAFYFIVGTPPGNPLVKQRILSSLSGWSHIIGGLVSMATGPFQFLILYNKQPKIVHRWVGRVYVAAIAAGGIGGLSVSLDSLAYPVGDYGFAVLAIVWLVTAAFGLQAARERKWVAHQEWMLRNFALTYAAVMLRWQLPLYIFLGNSAAGALTATAFTCWIPNLVFVEWWIQRRPRKMVIE